MNKTCSICRGNYNTVYRNWYDNFVPNVCSGPCYEEWIIVEDTRAPILPGDMFPLEKKDKSRRSSYEQRYENWLLERGISYAYEPYSFKLSKMLYVPDFLLNLGTFVEVKGIWNPGDKTKVKEFHQTGRHIHIVDEEFLRRLNRERANKKHSSGLEKL